MIFSSIMNVKKIKNIKSEIVSAGEGTSRRVLISSDEAPNFAMRKFIIEPGGGIPAHTNTFEHEQYVLAGSATIGMGDEVYEVEKDDVIYIPAGVPHWYEVRSEESFEFLCMVPNGDDKIELVKKS